MQHHCHKWTGRGNLVLVVTARHGSTIEQLRASLPLSPQLVNVKWSRVVLNRVPSGASKRQDAYTPDECHAALAAENPSYARNTRSLLLWTRLCVLPIICL
ncbi:hypothetical protein BJV78DRAFT_1259599 [Lactifluus subvellereus]|nr:hypothetical protein BJV78DRAFT_1259599 [Lactifluus subvellereus]